MTKILDLKIRAELIWDDSWPETFSYDGGDTLRILVTEGRCTVEVDWSASHSTWVTVKATRMGDNFPMHTLEPGSHPVYERAIALLRKAGTSV